MTMDPFTTTEPQKLASKVLNTILITMNFLLQDDSIYIIETLDQPTYHEDCR